MVGTASKESFDLYTEILKKMNLWRVLVIYSPVEGMDEISGSSPAEAALIEKGKVIRFQINASKFGFKKSRPDDLKITSVKDSKEKTLKIFTGKDKGSAADVVILNAGAAIWTAGKSATLKEGVELARESIHSGKAFHALKNLVRNSRA